MDSVADYDFPLPEELIAQSPSANPEDARLLIVRIHPVGGLPRFEISYVRDLPDLVRAYPQLSKTRWVRNRSAVFKGRIYARRPTGGRHEILFLAPENSDETVWSCLIRGSAHFKCPQDLEEEKLKWSLTALSANRVRVENIRELFEKVGEMPLPPYIQDRNPLRDNIRYQPVWSDPRHAYSAAAPTASLHFTPGLVERLKTAGVAWADIYLNVGLGTFEPLRHDSVNENKLHGEKFFVPRESLALLEARTDFTCVGTTAMRCVESLGKNSDVDFHCMPEGLSGETRIFIKPGFEFTRTKNLWTNFHLPKSSLFILMSTFAGSLELAKEAYAFAIKNKMRFFSYGDASLWLK